MSKYLYLVLGIPVICLVFFLGWHMNGKRLNEQIEQIQLKHEAEKRAAEKLIATKEQEMQESISKKATEYQQSVTKTNQTIESLQKELKNVQKTKPLDCRLDADRLRIINEAYSAPRNSRTR